VAAYAFLLTLGFFATVLGAALWRTPARGATIVALRFALFSLLVTAGLGATLASGWRAARPGR
jgi:hypothetical protein